jgi:hypothetical protein
MSHSTTSTEPAGEARSCSSFWDRRAGAETGSRLKSSLIRSASDELGQSEASPWAQLGQSEASPWAQLGQSEASPWAQLGQAQAPDAQA